MNCDRCSNLMFPVALQDWGGGLMNQDVAAWRCFACGEIVDQLIAQNRSREGEDAEEWRRGGARRRVNGIGLLR
ncbi:MAG: hypothetical protein LZF60_80036 [Nitrospira sp.]|nr:hypothetical protein [Nitrospira sp.]ULA58645.1 MAG: hypothetical protein LZF60_80036 [Nitrospira sp.]